MSESQFEMPSFGEVLGESAYPDSDTLWRLLRECLLASAKLEEGRCSTFAVAALHNVGRTPGLLHADGPVPATADNLAKWGVATSAECSTVIVTLDGSGLWQIVGVGPLLQIDRHDPQSVPIELFAPLELVLRIGDTIIECVRGTISSRTVDEDPLAPISTQYFVPRLMSEMAPFSGNLLPLGTGALVANQERLDRHEASYRDRVKELAPEMALEGLAKIIASMRRIGQGGAILIPPTPGAHESLVKSGTRLKSDDRQLPLRGWNAGLFDYFGWKVQDRLAARATTVTEELGEDADLGDWRKKVAEPRLHVAHELWWSDARMIAGLTALDGAVVLDDSLSPVHFGAKLEVPASVTIPEETAQFLKLKGTRHRSMARTVQHLKGGVGIVVSQDGPTTLMTFGEAGVEARKAIIAPMSIAY